MKLYADTNNGVMKDGDDDLTTEVIADEQAFYARLRDLPDDAYIRCDTVTDEMAAKIEREYGIQKTKGHTMNLLAVEKMSEDELLAAAAYYENAPKTIQNTMVYAVILDEVEERCDKAA